MIVNRCPGCDTRFEFADELDGKRIKCKNCGDIFRVERPGRKARDKDDRPPPARRRDEDDDRPKSKVRQLLDSEEEEDRDDRPSRNRRAAADDDDLPRGRRRDDDDEMDDRRPGRQRDEDDEDDTPRRKKRVHPLLIVLPILGLLATVMVIIFATRGKRGGPDDFTGELVKAPSQSCPLDVAEKDAGTLVIPDSGNVFGLVRKGADPNPARKSWAFEPYDMAVGRRIGHLPLTGVEDPRAFSLSPDGKHLLVVESKGFGNPDLSLTLWSLADGKNLTPEKWIPFPKDKHDSPALYKAEFVGNDRVLTLGTNRSFYIYQLPAFEPVQAMLHATGDPLGRSFFGIGSENLPKMQWQAAFNADRSRMAVWVGDAYEVVGTADGVRTYRTPSVQQLAKELWPRGSFLDRHVKAGPVAFSPDGKVLAGVLTYDFGGKDHVLCLWDTTVADKQPTTYAIPANQFNDSHEIGWWGNKYVVTSGGRSAGAEVEGMLIEVGTGRAVRQLMGPEFRHYGLARDGRLWYAASEKRNDPATMYVVDAPDAELANDPEVYEQIRELKEEFFLRRLWLEPRGVLREPTRLNPPLQQRLIRRP